MKPSEYARMLEIIAGMKSVTTDTIYLNNSGQDFSLKTYLVDVGSHTNLVLDKVTIRQIIKCCLVNRQSGIGVAIASPPFYGDYQRFYSFNMWKSDTVDGKTVYKHNPDNTLFAIREDVVIPFEKTSDNLCTLELQIMGKEGLLWQKVVLGEKGLEQYLHEFVKVV